MYFYKPFLKPLNNYYKLWTDNVLWTDAYIDYFPIGNLQDDYQTKQAGMHK